MNSEIAANQSFKDFVAAKIKGGFVNRRMPLEIQQVTVHSKFDHFL